MHPFKPERRSSAARLAETRLLAQAFALVFLATAMVAGAPSFAAAGDDDMNRSITVQASGSVAVPPDAVQVRSGVQTNADTAKAALAENTSLMSNVIDGLKAMGVESKDIQTANFSVQPRYQHHRDGRPADVTGYQVTNEVNVLLRDLEKVGVVLDKLIQLGANQMRGLDFQVLDAEKLRDEARREAIANARRRAELYAAAAGAKVGEVIEIREGSVSSPGPERMVKSMARSADVPVEAGEETLSASVTVTWALE